MSSRFFKLHEAEECIPLLENLLNNAISRKKQVETLESEFSGLRHRILMSGGILVDYDKMSGLKSERDQSVSQLREALEQIESTGCVIKDLDIGLVDFPCMMGDREIYLCWKLGEPSIQFWHHTNEGFASRKPIQEIENPDDSKRPN